MPGMGLTGVGLAGLILSYAGIAHTFIDGMHALTGLTMFVGLIFTAAGILDGGVSTSNRAKITTLVIVGISIGFGLYALGTMNSSDYTFSLILVILAIALPSAGVAWIAMKKPGSIKPIGLVLGLAVASGLVIWITAGSMSESEAELAEEIHDEAMDDVPAGPIFEIEILKEKFPDLPEIKKIKLFRTNRNPKVQYDFEETEISDVNDEGLNSWENFTKEILEFLDTLPNHIRIQINTKLFEGEVPKNQESFDSGMAEFSNELHVIAIEETKILEEWEKIYQKPENKL